MQINGTLHLKNMFWITSKGIWTYISIGNYTTESLKARKVLCFSILFFYMQLKFNAQLGWERNTFITFGHHLFCLLLYLLYKNNVFVANTLTSHKDLFFKSTLFFSTKCSRQDSRKFSMLYSNITFRTHNDSRSTITDRYWKHSYYLFG